MDNQGRLKALPDPESLALRIAAKSAFLASRTARDAAISTLAQQSAEHTRLQEIHRGLSIQLEQKEAQILNLKELAANAQDTSAKRELELQRTADSARTSSLQEKAQHARLKERYRNCITELERKDAEILELHGKIKVLSRKQNDTTQAAHAASKEFEVELNHLRTLFQERGAELEEKPSRISKLNGTTERPTEECSNLEEAGTFLQEAVNRRTSDLKHATDAAAVSLAQREAEKRLHKDVIHGQSTQIEEKGAHILDLEGKAESLVQKSNNLRSKAAGVKYSLAAMTQDLKQITTEAFAKITAAEAVKAATDQRVTELLSNVEALEEAVLRCKNQLKDAAQVQSQTEGKRSDAVASMLKLQAASDQLKRDNALLSAEVNNLQTRRDSLVRTLAVSSEAQARMKKDLCSATKTISTLKASENEACGTNTTLAARIKQLHFDKDALQMRLDNPPPSTPPPVMGAVHQMYGNQNPQLPVQVSSVRDDSDLYDWHTARASGRFDFWADNLHGSEIMPLLSIETSQDDMVVFISKLLFPRESQKLVAWLSQRFQDHNREQLRLRVVHLLNDAMGHYGCTCHRVHIYPNGSKDQDIHVRFALEALQVYGTFEDACDIFVAMLSCFNGKRCLEYLEECEIFLDRSERKLLTQRCQDKLRGVLV